MKPDEAARKWLANVWPEHEQNYLRDIDVDEQLQDALDHCLVQAFHAGVEWQRKNGSIRARVEGDMLVNIDPVTFEVQP
jgi:hypothetical protein